MDHEVVNIARLDCNGCNLNERIENATVEQVSGLVALAMAHKISEPTHEVHMTCTNRPPEPRQVWPSRTKQGAI